MKSIIGIVMFIMGFIITIIMTYIYISEELTYGAMLKQYWYLYVTSFPLLIGGFYLQVGSNRKAKS